MCELMAFTYGLKGFDRETIFRPHNVYGPDMGNGHVLPQFVARAKQLIASQPEGCIDFEIQGSGEETRSFVNIDDFIVGLMLVCDKGQTWKSTILVTKKNVRLPRSGKPFFLSGT